MVTFVAPERRAFWRISCSVWLSVPSKNCITFAIASSAMQARIVLAMGFSFRVLSVVGHIGLLQVLTAGRPGWRSTSGVWVSAGRVVT